MRKKKNLKWNMSSKNVDIDVRDYYIIIIIMACRWHGFPWSSSATRPYCSSLSAGLPCYTLYQYRAVVDRLQQVTYPCSSVWRGQQEYIAYDLALLLLQSPTCLARLVWMVFEMLGRCPYSCCFVGCCLQDLFNTTRSILVQ